jgi:hypothetical protein
MSSPGRGRYAIIPTHNRHEQVAALVDILRPEVDLIVIIDNASEPPMHQPRQLGDGQGGAYVLTVPDSEQPPNLTRLWTVGLDAVRFFRDHNDLGDEQPTWDVALLNDDATLPPGWFQLCANAMREHGAAACSVDQRLQAPLLKTAPDGDLGRRLFGPAFVIRGEMANQEGDPLWPDITIQWWFQDTDLDWRARALGGTLLIPGPFVGNTGANSSTVGPLAEQAGRDRETFRQKWGWVPW